MNSNHAYSQLNPENGESNKQHDAHATCHVIDCSEFSKNFQETMACFLECNLIQIDEVKDGLYSIHQLDTDSEDFRDYINLCGETIAQMVFSQADNEGLLIYMNQMDEEKRHYDIDAVYLHISFTKLIPEWRMFVEYTYYEESKDYKDVIDAD
jgi:hypothetical protein